MIGRQEGMWLHSTSKWKIRQTTASYIQKWRRFFKGLSHLAFENLDWSESIACTMRIDSIHVIWMWMDLDRLHIITDVVICAFSCTVMHMHSTLNEQRGHIFLLHLPPGVLARGSRTSSHELQKVLNQHFMLYYCVYRCFQFSCMTVLDFDRWIVARQTKRNVCDGSNTNMY